MFVYEVIKEFDERVYGFVLVRMVQKEMLVSGSSQGRFFGEREIGIGLMEEGGCFREEGIGQIEVLGQEYLTVYREDVIDMSLIRRGRKCW